MWRNIVVRPSSLRTIRLSSTKDVQRVVRRMALNQLNKVGSVPSKPEQTAEIIIESTVGEVIHKLPAVVEYECQADGTRWYRVVSKLASVIPLAPELIQASQFFIKPYWARLRLTSPDRLTWVYEQFCSTFIIDSPSCLLEMAAEVACAALLAGDAPPTEEYDGQAFTDEWSEHHQAVDEDVSIRIDMWQQIHSVHAEKSTLNDELDDLYDNDMLDARDEYMKRIIHFANDYPVEFARELNNHL
jgi:hypothetical protein